MRGILRKLADKTSLFLLRFRWFDRLIGFLHDQRTRMMRRRTGARVRGEEETVGLVLHGAHRSTVRTKPAGVSGIPRPARSGGVIAYRVPAARNRHA